MKVHQWYCQYDCFVLWLSNIRVWGFPGGLVVKNAPEMQGHRFDP